MTILIKKTIAIIILICIVSNSLSIFNIFIYADEKQDAQDREKGYENGFKWGDMTGAIYGYKDKASREKSNWEKAYKEIKSKIVSDYKLDKESYPYRSKFLEGFEEGFQKGYERGYKNVAFDSTMDAKTIGIEHGSFFGRLLGENQGRSDYSKRLGSDWTRNLPADSTLIQEYRLNNDSREYSDAFLEGYKSGYEEQYIFTYRTANFDGQRVTKEMGYDHGFDAGKDAGAALGAQYYVDGKVNNWQIALNQYGGQQPLLTRFLLLRETSQYQQGFIEGFRDGFRDSFVQAYQDLNMKIAAENVNWKRVGMFGEKIEYAETVMNFVNGNTSENSIKLIELTIEPGTIYRDTYIGLLKEEESFTKNYGYYESATKVFEVKIFNDINLITLKKPMKLSFQYFGTDRAGIYRQVGNQWIYQYSVIEDGIIWTEIPPSEYCGGKYAVLIDDRYQELKDISTYWANKELYTYLRRAYINGNGDGIYSPEKPISRGDFLVLLGTVEKWNYSGIKEQGSHFKDYPTFGAYTHPINYAISKGLMSGFSDNTFKPDAPISYREIENIMQKIIGDPEFTWERISDKMLYEKYTRSGSRHDKSNHISRGEVVYMLYQLELSQAR